MYKIRAWSFLGHPVEIYAHAYMYNKCKFRNKNDDKKIVYSNYIPTRINFLYFTSEILMKGVTARRISKIINLKH